MRRRALMAGLPAALLTGLTASRAAAAADLVRSPGYATAADHRAAAAAAAAADQARRQALAALADYCGVYRLSPGHTIGVDRFINDDGDAVLLFSDHRTGVTRRLFQSAPGEFSIGPQFNTPTPVELTLHVERLGSGPVSGLVVRDADGRTMPAPKAASREEQVSFHQANARLAGTLILPEGPGPHPAVVLLHGSGPLTRYSFGPYPRFFNALGLAVLIYDKRGTGQSTGRRLDASTGAPAILRPTNYPDDLRADALAAFRFLQGRPEIDARRIGFWGSSEGGMLSTQAAAHAPDAAFAINSSGFMGPLWQTLLYQGAAKMKRAGRPKAEVDAALAFNQFWMDVARTGQGYKAFLSQRAQILAAGKTEQLFYVSDEFSSLKQMRWAWSHILTFDPVPALGRVKCPSLGVFGQDDVLTDTAGASEAMRSAIVAGGNRDVTVRIFPNAGHSLMETSPGGRMGEGVYDTLRDWLVARTGAVTA